MRTFFKVEGGDSEFVNFSLANFKDIFGGPSSECAWQQAITCCSCYRTPPRPPPPPPPPIFFFFFFFFFKSPRTRDLLVSQKTMQRHFFCHAPSPFPGNFWKLQQWWHLHCFAIIGSTSIVIHSVKQRLLRNRPGSDAATSRDFLRERLQRAFTRANQLHWTARYLTLRCHHQNDSSIEMGSRESHLNVSLMVSDWSYETVSTDHNFWRERRASEWNRGPSAYLARSRTDFARSRTDFSVFPFSR